MRSGGWLKIISARCFTSASESSNRSLSRSGFAHTGGEEPMSAMGSKRSFLVNAWTAQLASPCGQALTSNGSGLRY
jgi:hypothetical protein